MKVLVDTAVWSLALRRRAGSSHPAVEQLRSLIDEGRVAMVGPIRQELLSGIRTRESFERLRDALRPFEDEPLERADFERAAEHFNACRASGIQGSNTDFLLCAVAERRRLPILTTDSDFTRFAAVIPIALHGRADGARKPAPTAAARAPARSAARPSARRGSRSAAVLPS